LFSIEDDLKQVALFPLDLDDLLQEIVKGFGAEEVEEVRLQGNSWGYLFV